MSTCACGNDWRFEAVDLRSGIVIDVLHPQSADFETLLNDPGQGSLRLATRDVAVRSIWPHLTCVYCLRISGGAASPANPVAEFAGLIEEISADNNGATNVGMKGIEQYLNHRMMREKATFQQMNQNLIGAALVQLAADEGIQLTASGDPSFAMANGHGLRDRTYESWDRKFIGEAIKQLTEVIEGPDWITTHTRTAGVWSSHMTFMDIAGVVRELTLRSDIESHEYGLQVDANDHATLVDALGEGEEQDMLTALAKDNTGVYPRFDASPAWKDVSVLNTLQEHADGYLEEHREPIAIPSVEISGFDIDPTTIELGDTIGIKTNYGAVSYNGQARIIGRSWKIDAESLTKRGFELVPITRASEAVLGQASLNNECKDC